MKKLWALLLFPWTTFAAAPPVSNGGILSGPAKDSNGKDFVAEILLPNLTNGFLTFLMVVSVVMFIIAGLMYIFSAGKEELAEKARMTIIWTCIAVGVGILAFTIVKLIININFVA